MSKSKISRPAPPLPPETVIPLSRWIHGDPSSRPARWARWQLWPSGDASYHRTVGPYVVRAHHDAGGFYAELADAASGRTLAFVYPFPMRAWWMSMSRFDEYDWANADRDREAAIMTAIAAARLLMAVPDAAWQYRGALDVPLPALPTYGVAMLQAEAARRRFKAARRAERPKRQKGHKADPAANAWLRRQLDGLGKEGA